MVTQSNIMNRTEVEEGLDLPFQLILLEGVRQREIPIEKLFTSAKQIKSTRYEVDELVTLKLLLKTDVNVDIEIEWGTTLRDDDDPLSFTLTKEDNKATIYDASDDDEYPWRCGMYYFTIHYEKKRYLAAFYIRPRNISHEQLNKIHELINSELKGLAFDYMSHKQGYQSETALLEIANWLGSHNRQLQHALFLIEQHSQTELSRHYVIDNEPKRLDYRSIRWQNQAKGQVYKGIKYMNRQFTSNWDSPANQLVKYQLKNLLNKLQDTINYVKKDDDKIRLLKEKYHIFTSILHTAFWQGVSEGSSHRMVEGRHVGYQLFHQLCQSFNKLTSEKTSQEMKFPVYKPTYLLYEYYIYFITIHIFEGLNFQRVTESITAQLRSTFFEEGLEDRTTITLEKDDVRITITYEDIIEFNEHIALEKGSHFFSSSKHRKPDVRIDLSLLKGGEWLYQSSLILEVKYRPFYNIYSDKRQTKTMEQMNSYWLIRYVASNGKTRSFNHRPVQKVICIYPGASNLPVTYETGQGMFLQIYPKSNSDDLYSAVGKEQLVGEIRAWLGE